MRLRKVWSRLGLAVAITTVVIAVDPPEPARAAPPADSTTDSSASTTPEQPAVLEVSAELDGFMASVDAWDFAAAERRRGALHNPRERELAEGILAVYEARYAEAESTLAALVAGSTDQRIAAGILDIRVVA